VLGEADPIAEDSACEAEIPTGTSSSQWGCLLALDGLCGGWDVGYVLQRAVPLALLDHRIIACYGLEGSLRGHLAQAPCSEQGCLRRDQVAQSPVQPGLECFQGWGLHCLSGSSSSSVAGWEVWGRRQCL